MAPSGSRLNRQANLRTYACHVDQSRTSDSFRPVAWCFRIPVVGAGALRPGGVCSADSGAYCGRGSGGEGIFRVWSSSDSHYCPGADCQSGPFQFGCGRGYRPGVRGRGQRRRHSYRTDVRGWGFTVGCNEQCRRIVAFDAC